MSQTEENQPLQNSCPWFSYGSKSNTCLLFNTCPSLNEAEVDYISGQPECFELANEITKHIAANHFNIVFKHLIERIQEEGNESLVQEQINQIESQVKELQIQENQQIFESTEDIKKNKSVPCGKCDKRFRTKNCLRQHDRHVHQKVRYPCQNCPKTFASKQMMKRHFSKRHKLEQKKEKVSKIDGIKKKISMPKLSKKLYCQAKFGITCQ